MRGAFLRGVVIVALVVASWTSASSLEDDHHDDAFRQFIRDYKRSYASPEEEAHRYATFVRNLKWARELQALNPLGTFGINAYVDFTPEEFQSRHALASVLTAERREANLRRFNASTPLTRATYAPPVMDWRLNNAVTYVRNQGDCGSCWSFSATGNIEGQWAIHKQQLIPLSEQTFVSCDSLDGACQGGDPIRAIKWLVEGEGGGLPSELTYPYVSGSGAVPACALPQPAAAVMAWGNCVVPNTEVNMALTVGNYGPLSVCVDASTWQTWSGGIMTSCPSGATDHCVLIVGYDLSFSTPYWIIKNSWGTQWGEEGYLRLAYGYGLCMVNSQPCGALITQP